MRHAAVLSIALSLALTSDAFAEGAIEVESKPVSSSIASVLGAHSIELSSSDLVLRGTVERKGKRFRLVLNVVGPSGIVASHRFAGKTKRALAKNVESRLWSKLGDAISNVVAAGRESPPPEAAAPPVVPVPNVVVVPPEPSPGLDTAPNTSGGALPKTTQPTPEPAAPSHTLGLEAKRTSVYLQIGGGVFNRSLSYKDDLFGAMNGYELGAAPVMQVRASWYPGAHLGKGGALANIGIEVQYEAPFGLDTEGASGESFPTQAFAWNAAALYRATLSSWNFTGGVGYGNRSFHVSDGEMGEARPDVPDVDYQQFGAQLSLSTPAFAGVGVELRGGLHHVVSSGDIGSAAWFPQSSANGALGELVVAYSLGDQIGVYVGASLLQQGFDLAPEPGDAHVAGGAIDRYVSATMGLRYAGN